MAEDTPKTVVAFREDYIVVRGAGGVVRCAIVDHDDSPSVVGVKWHESGRSRAVYARNYKLGQMHHYLLGDVIPTGQIVDHINGNTLDNRRENLRLATRTQNLWNSQKHCKSSSRYKGVCRNNNRWRATLYKNKTKHNLGSFVNEEDAARAYDNAAKRLYGKYARCNFVT